MSIYDDEPKVACSNCKGLFPSSKAPLHEAYCCRNIRKCPECAMFVDKNETEEHRAEFHTKLSCDKCGSAVANIAALTKHTESECRLRPKTCKYCDVKVPMQDFEQHQLACGSRTKQCGLCQKNVLLRDYEHHMDTCVGPQAEAPQQQQQQPYKRPMPFINKPATESSNPARPSIVSSSAAQQPISKSSNQAAQLEKRDIPASEQRRPPSKQGPGSERMNYNAISSGVGPTRPSLNAGSNQQQLLGQQNPSMGVNASRGSAIEAPSLRKQESGVTNGSSSRPSNSSQQSQISKDHNARLIEQNELPTQGYYDNLQTKKFSGIEKQEMQRNLGKPSNSNASSSSSTSTASTTTNSSSSSGVRPSAITGASHRNSNLMTQDSKAPATMSNNNNPASFNSQRTTNPTGPISSASSQTGVSASRPLGSIAGTGISSQSRNVNDILTNARLPQPSSGTASYGSSANVPSYQQPSKQLNQQPITGGIHATNAANYRPTSRGGALQAASANALNNIPSQKGVLPSPSSQLQRKGTSNYGGMEDEDEDLQRAIQESMRNREAPQLGKKPSGYQKDDYDDELQKAIHNSRKQK